MNGWQKVKSENTYALFGKPKWHLMGPEGAPPLALCWSEADADRILKDHKAAEELAALKAVWSDTHPPMPPTRAAWDDLIAARYAEVERRLAVEAEVTDLRSQLAMAREALEKIVEMDGNGYWVDDSPRRTARDVLSRISTQKAEG